MLVNIAKEAPGRTTDSISIVTSIHGFHPIFVTSSVGRRASRNPFANIVG